MNITFLLGTFLLAGLYCTRRLREIDRGEYQIDQGNGRHGELIALPFTLQTRATVDQNSEEYDWAKESKGRQSTSTNPRDSIDDLPVPVLLGGLSPQGTCGHERTESRQSSGYPGVQKESLQFTGYLGS